MARGHPRGPINRPTRLACDPKCPFVMTKEGDSEVLLIEDGVVYYRVNDSVFRAAVGQEGVGMPALLATDAHIG